MVIMRNLINNLMEDAILFGINNGTCDRARVGAVIFNKYDFEKIAAGANKGTGTEQCDSVGHLMVNKHCVRTVHAEQVALAELLKKDRKIDFDNLAIVISHRPCIHCFKMLYTLGIKSVYYNIEYGSEEDKVVLYKLANENNVILTRV